LCDGLRGKQGDTAVAAPHGGSYALRGQRAAPGVLSRLDGERSLPRGSARDDVGLIAGPARITYGIAVMLESIKEWLNKRVAAIDHELMKM
jgi:hypothetical protein